MVWHQTDGELDPESLKRFNGRVLMELTIAVGERYIVGPLQESWKISKYDYASVGEEVEVLRVNVAKACVYVRFVHRDFEWRGRQRYVESVVPLMTYRASHDGVCACVAGLYGGLMLCVLCRR